MVDSIVIRPARIEEREELGALKLESSLAWGDHLEALRALPDASRVPEEHLPFIFVAESCGEILGFATVLPPTGGDAELEDLFVGPGAWRRGVGTRLVAEAEARAIGMHAGGLRVIAGRRARAFYEARGFLPTGTVQTLLETALTLHRPLA